MKVIFFSLCLIKNFGVRCSVRIWVFAGKLLVFGGKREILMFGV